MKILIDESWGGMLNKIVEIALESDDGQRVQLPKGAALTMESPPLRAQSSGGFSIPHDDDDYVVTIRYRSKTKPEIEYLRGPVGPITVRTCRADSSPAVPLPSSQEDDGTVQGGDSEIEKATATAG